MVECIRCGGVLRGMCQALFVHPGSGGIFYIPLVLIPVSVLWHDPMAILVAVCQIQPSRRLPQSLGMGSIFLFRSNSSASELEMG